MVDHGGVRIGEYMTTGDASPSDWVSVGLQGFGESVLSVVPSGFEAYARIFHPAELGPGRPGVVNESEIQPVTWHEVAAANGRTAHRTMQWEYLVGGWRSIPGRQPVSQQPGVWDGEPSVGSLPRALSVDLAGLLAGYTATPRECFFGVWDGWAGLVVPESRTVSFHIPARRLLLLTGPVAAIFTSLQGPESDPHQSPNLWWPADQAWCVASEIDLDSTYVGASRACVDALLADPAFEVFAVDPSDGITVHSDTVNPTPP